MFLRCLIPTALAVVAGLSFTPPADACPGCGPPSGQTLTNEVAQADFILYGTLANAKPDPKDPGSTKGTTDMNIEAVVKSHALVKDKKRFTIPRFVPPDPKPYKYMVFFNVVNGDVDPYRGVVVGNDSKLPEYVKGALEVKGKDATARLRYFFDYLESNEIEISADAYNEFAVAEYKEVQDLAPKLPTDTVLKWLKDPNTRASRFGLYGLLLGHAPKDQARLAAEMGRDAIVTFDMGGTIAPTSARGREENLQRILDILSADPNLDAAIYEINAGGGGPNQDPERLTRMLNAIASTWPADAS